MVDNEDRSEGAGTEELDTAGATDEQKEVADPDEVYCTNCGRAINEAAELCPHCGVRQAGADASDRSETKNELSERRQYELESIANKSAIGGALLGCFFGPVGYIYVGKWGWALLNILTIHYFFLGFLLVPLHILKIISDAKSDLRMAGVGGY